MYRQSPEWMTQNQAFQLGMTPNRFPSPLTSPLRWASILLPWHCARANLVGPKSGPPGMVALSTEGTAFDSVECGRMNKGKPHGNLHWT